jgi:hypothetical protein
MILKPEKSISINPKSNHKKTSALAEVFLYNSLKASKKNISSQVTYNKNN